MHRWLVLQAGSSLGLSSEVSPFCDRWLILPCAQMVPSDSCVKTELGFPVLGVTLEFEPGICWLVLGVTPWRLSISVSKMRE